MHRATPRRRTYHVPSSAAQELHWVHANLRMMALLAQPTTHKPADLMLPRAQLSACFKSLGDSLRRALDSMTLIEPPAREDKPVLTVVSPTPE